MWGRFDIEVSDSVAASQTVRINQTAEIIADGQGYAAGNGPGAGIRNSWGGGGGYGGDGGTVNASGAGAYGSLPQPTDLGSGGSDGGASGGGAIQLVAATLQSLEGTIAPFSIEERLERQGIRHHCFSDGFRWLWDECRESWRD